MSTPNEEWKHFGDAFKAFVERKNITLPTLESRSGVNRETLKNWKAGKIKKPQKWEEVVRVAAALELNLSDANLLLRLAGYSPIEEYQTLGMDEKVKQAINEILARSLDPISAPGNKTEALTLLRTAEDIEKVAPTSQQKPNTSKAQNVTVQLTLSEIKAQKNLESLRRIVEQIWIHGVLEHSLNHEVAIQLSLKDSSNLVDNRPWKIIPRRENLSPDITIIDAFDLMNGYLLILGEPGAGKTTLLLELTRVLLKRADETLAEPTPVVFNLSSWGQNKTPLEKWLVEELRIRYNISKNLAQNWIKQDDLLLLLDGLDEVHLAHRDACVEAINQFHQEHHIPLVVCSRISDYENLSVRLKLQGAVLLESLTAQQIDQYLAKAGPALVAVRETLQQDTELQELAKSPLMLNIMALAYQNATLVELRLIDTTQTRRQHLFDTYIQHMFERRETKLIYSPTQTIQWLKWLATRLVEYGQSIFLIERMQPSWLQTNRHRLALTPLTMLFAMSIYGSIFGLIFGLVGGLIAGLFAKAPLTLSTLPKLPSWLIVGSLLGLIFGSFIGFAGSLIDLLSGRFRKINPIEQSNIIGKRLKSSFYATLFWGLTGGLVTWLVFERNRVPILDPLALSEYKNHQYNIELIANYLNNMWLNNWLSNWLTVTLPTGLILGLSVGLIWGLIIVFQQSESLIRTEWSWRKIKSNLYYGTILGLTTGVSYGLLGELTSKLGFGLITIGRIVCGLILGLVFGTIIGLAAKLRDLLPNLKRNAYTLLFYGLTGVLCGGLSTILIIMLSHGLSNWISNRLAIGLEYGIGLKNTTTLESIFWTEEFRVKLSTVLYNGIDTEGWTLKWLIKTLFATLFIDFRNNTTNQMSDTLNGGLVVGLGGGLVGAFRQIETVPYLRWSWQKVKSNLYFGFTVTLGMGIFWGVYWVLFNKFSNDNFWLYPRNILISTLISSIIFGLIGGLLFQPAVETDLLLPLKQQTPNQGIWLAAKYSSILSLTFGLFTGLIGGMISSLNNTLNIGLAGGILYGVPGALVFGLIGCSDAVIKHVLLRLILRLKGNVPWNYARFLDYATTLIFLRKVGGGYIFVHRLVMEHFASLDEETTKRITAASTNQK